MDSYSLNLHTGFILKCLYMIMLFNMSYSVPLETNLHHSLFPNNFLFGTASSSYQFEGAFSSEGKGLSNWDIFTHQADNNILDGSNGDVAVDHYHRYLEDISLMEDLGVNSYRFSISWARILPRGRFGNVNMAGIEHYNKLIDALLQKGIYPFVSLTHYDIPQELEDRYGAWLSPKVQDDFRDYADICFHYFGDRVKYWVTFNEPNVVAIRGYKSGIYPPSRCSPSFGNCSSGDSEKEPFIAAHNMILSHAAAVNTYRTKYQKTQGGSIGIVINAIWFEPFSNSSEDKSAAERAQSFFMNWFLDPIIFGRYPAEMQRILGSQLPTFSSKDLNRMRHGVDFIGINHYTSFYAKDCMYSACEPGPGVSKSEGYYLRTAFKDGIPIGENTDVDWINRYPPGMEKIVTYVKDRYNNTPMFITENGIGEQNNPRLSAKDFLFDHKRVDYMNSYLDSLASAMRKGADVRGYFAWALFDNFEWLYGYTVRFGLHHIDYATLKRTPKFSALWYKHWISNHSSFPNKSSITRNGIHTMITSVK